MGDGSSKLEPEAALLLFAFFLFFIVFDLSGS